MTMVNQSWIINYSIKNFSFPSFRFISWSPTQKSLSIVVDDAMILVWCIKNVSDQVELQMNDMRNVKRYRTSLKRETFYLPITRTLSWRNDYWFNTDWSYIWYWWKWYLNQHFCRKLQTFLKERKQLRQSIFLYCIHLEGYRSERSHSIRITCRDSFTSNKSLFHR
jgi:hypothetical protein